MKNAPFLHWNWGILSYMGEQMKSVKIKIFSINYTRSWEISKYVEVSLCYKISSNLIDDVSRNIRERNIRESLVRQCDVYVTNAQNISSTASTIQSSHEISKS